MGDKVDTQKLHNWERHLVSSVMKAKYLRDKLFWSTRLVSEKSHINSPYLYLFLVTFLIVTSWMPLGSRWISSEISPSGCGRNCFRFTAIWLYWDKRGMRSPDVSEQREREIARDNNPDVARRWTSKRSFQFFSPLTSSETRGCKSAVVCIRLKSRGFESRSRISTSKDSSLFWLNE